MCLLVGVVAEVRTPRWVVYQPLVLGSSFCGCGSSKLEPPTMGIAVALSSIAAAIPLRWWRMVARSKAHDPLYRSAWSAADRPDNKVADMAIPLAPSNLRQDSMAPAGAKRAMAYCLI